MEGEFDFTNWHEDCDNDWSTVKIFSWYMENLYAYSKLMCQVFTCEKIRYLENSN